jgi:hypothetical protein
LNGLEAVQSVREKEDLVRAIIFKSFLEKMEGHKEVSENLYMRSSILATVEKRKSYCAFTIMNEHS